MREFLVKLGVRLLLFLAVLLALFYIPLPHHYYSSLIDNSAFNKVPWVQNQISKLKPDSDAIIFMGPSVFESGIDDSLLSALTGKQVINYGISQTYYDMDELFIDKLLLVTHPKRIIFCSLYAEPRSAHPVFSLVATPSQILSTFTECNFSVFDNILNRTAWNSNYITQHVKLRTLLNTPFNKQYGQNAQTEIDTNKIKNLLNNSIPEFTKFIELTGNENLVFENVAPLKRLYRLAYYYKLKYTLYKNIDYQLRALKRIQTKLAAQNIQLDIIYFYTLEELFLNKSQVFIDRYKKSFSKYDIDIKNLHILPDTALKDFRNWSDCLHLNKRGATEYSRFLYDNLLKNGDGSSPGSKLQ
jgi:hypothetical protein